MNTPTTPLNSPRAELPRHPRPTSSDLGDVQLKPWHGRPTVWRDGEPVLMPAYCNSIVSEGGPGNEDRWFEWVENFIKSGVKVFQLDLGRYKGQYGQSSFWTDEDEYPDDAPRDEPLSTDRRARYILEKVPDALLIVRPNAYAPKTWMAKNSGELQTDSQGRTYEPSWASEKYLDGLRKYLSRLIAYHEGVSWANRIIGYEVMPMGEGYTLLSIEDNFFDQSPAMLKAWRSWLTKRYGSDEALQKAWSCSDVRLATVEVPRDSELASKVREIRHWPPAAEMQRERDYALLHKELLARWFQTIISSIKSAVTRRSVLIGIDALKQPLMGWQLWESFCGKGAGPNSFSIYLGSGSIGIGPLLDTPGLTNLLTPGDYTARNMGCGFEAEGIADSMVLRGKTLIIENDIRTFVSGELPNGRKAAGTFNDLAEVRAGFQRNTALAMSRGMIHYWTDITGSGSMYADEGVQKEVRLDKALFENCSSWPHRETEHAIALIIDDESPLYENFTNGFQQLAVLRQRIEGLALAGIPYRIYLLSDLSREAFPDYRCYLFPNLFKVDDEVLALLRKKVFRDGKMAIFGPGTGITDGITVSKDGAEKVLGIPMRLTEFTASRRVRMSGRDLDRLPPVNYPAFYGDSFMYGPILSPEPDRLAESDIQILGDFIGSWEVNAPGLVMKEHGNGAANNGRPGPRGADDYAVAFSMAMPIPAPVLRGLSAHGGCNIWCDEDVVISASDTMVSVHGSRKGEHVIRLPRRVKRVIDAVTGNLEAADTREIRLAINPPETRTFLLD